jgi:hypothetical protein
MTTLNVNAQTKLFNSGDKVVVQISSTYGKVYVHEMSAKQTVYTLAKTFDQRMKDVQSVNPGIDFNNMKIGQKIRVPFLAASIVKNPSDVIKGGEYVNVYYKIRPKDNLYRIAKVYFDTSIENLMAINNTSTFDLKADELIKVGWMPIGNTPLLKQADYSEATPTVTQQPNPSIVATTNVQEAKPNLQTSSHQASTSRAVRKEEPKKKGFFARVFGSKNKKKSREDKEIKEVVHLSDQLEQKPAPVQQETATIESTTPPVVNQMPTEQAVYESKVEIDVNDLDAKDVNDAPEYVYKSEKGIAIWNQSSSNSKNMFVLHPTAAVGSFIEITNPMLNKTVQAKVIGNIPPRTYTDDVSIVVSPRVAKMLGVVDRRFAVTVKYRE